MSSLFLAITRVHVFDFHNTFVSDFLVKYTIKNKDEESMKRVEGCENVCKSNGRMCD